MITHVSADDTKTMGFIDFGKYFTSRVCTSNPLKMLWQNGAEGDEEKYKAYIRWHFTRLLSMSLQF